MKGVIFTDFLIFVEKNYSYEMVDKIISKSNLISNGAYTSIGTYDTSELLQLVKALSQETDKQESEILIEYGKYLFGQFVAKYPMFLKKKTNTFDFLSQVESYIHHEVKKYYPDSQPPSIKCTLQSPHKLILNYSSTRPLSDLAEGLIKGCIKFHKDDISVLREDLPTKTGAKARFMLTDRKEHD